ncbi:hypothetical protein HHA03_06520 [Halolactibacillus halophilus]|uniref:Major facilitator superfamily (MFS) profile domain-containing protein n=2 Tax=Halolactibacillus halophilus TaxID=306540 RepID=A0ABQ0VJ16_9BACI|nr:hypothetical protein HHA03_06520 [Halolactibacillus halophilus]
MFGGGSSIGLLPVAYINDATGGYNTALYIFSGLVGITFVISLVMKQNIRSFERQSIQAN